MRILFIYPQLYAQVGFNYGLAHISAVLKADGHETKLLDINEKLGFDLDFSRIRREVEQFRPGLIGLSIVTNQYQFAKEIAGSIREYSDAPIICGGPHATMAPAETLRTGLFDFVCVGEGELATRELVARLANGEPTDRVPNIWTKSDGQIIENKVRPFVSLDALPPKDYDLFDFQRMIDAKNGWVGIMASRGCPFQCTYCFNHRMVQIYKEDTELPFSKLGYIRRHSVEDVIREMTGLLERYQNINTFIFDDDLFTLDKGYLLELCERYRKEVALPFVCNAHVKVFDEEMAAALKEAGCKIVKFGLESGSERVRREILRRFMKNDEIARAFAAADKFGLHTSAFVMFGFPHETKSEILDTVRLLGRIKPGRFRWAIFFPYPSTRAYEISKQGGFLDEQKVETLPNFTDASALDFGAEHNQFIRRLQKLFPWYVNALSTTPAAETYAPIVEEMERLDDSEWEAAAEGIVDRDQALSGELTGQGQFHYAYRFNSFTAVRSDWHED